MNALIKNFLLILNAGCFLQLCACTKAEKTTSVPVNDTTLTYFSIKNYIKGQVALLYGQPFTLTRIATLNGQRDSSFVNFYNMDMGKILKTFLATDISSANFLGKYKFSSFEEPATGNQDLMYEAIDPNAFTRSFTFTVDPTNGKVLSLYTVTAKNTAFTELHQRLLYIPLKVIQIQEDESGTFSKKRNLRVEYRFLQ